MNRQQTVSADQTMKKFMQQNKLRPMFAQLTKQLLLKKPEDPMSFLIQYLSKRNKRQIICIHGYDHQNRVRVSNAVANKFNFRHINLSEIFPGDYNSISDQIINQKVSEALKKTESVYKGIIISGYPCNSVQADFIQKSGNLPDRYFMLPDNQEKIRAQYDKIYNDKRVVEDLLTRNKLETRQLRAVLKELVDDLPQASDVSIQRINSAIGIKYRKIVPFQSPRIIFIHPPYLKPSCLQAIVDRYCFHSISLQSAMKKLSEKKKFEDYVEQYIRKSKSLSKQVQLALIETECKSAAAKNKGYLINGWPTTKSNAAFLKEQFLKPHFIFIFTAIQQHSIEKYKALNSADSSLFAVVPKPSEEEYLKDLNNYNELVDQLKGLNNVQVMNLEQKEARVLKNFENFLQNSKIYS